MIFCTGGKNLCKSGCSSRYCSRFSLVKQRTTGYARGIKRLCLCGENEKKNFPRKMVIEKRLFTGRNTAVKAQRAEKQSPTAN